MELVVLLADERPHLMQDGGHLQQQPVVLGKAVQVLKKI